MQRATAGKTVFVIRVAAICLAAMAPMITGASPADSVTGNKLACTAKKGAGDVVDYSCPVVATGAPQSFRFSATFVGSHDDTVLSMKPTLNGTAIVCEPGSKTSSSYEDGDVVLECRFKTTAKAGTNVLLVIGLKWYHAQLAQTVFVSE
jgi:hypothetical protein